MRLLIKIFLSLTSLILIYFLIWFSWGSYAKSYIKTLMDTPNLSSGTKISYNKIRLSGFPFNIKLNITNLKLKNDHGFQIWSPKTFITTNFTIKKLDISLDQNLQILQPNSGPLTVHFKNGAHITAKLYSSALKMLIASSNFNLTDVSTIHYLDYGFSVMDTEQNEKIFISNTNSIKIQSFITSTNDFNLRIRSSLNGRGSIFLDNKKIRGENFLNTDVIISTNYNKDSYINNMSINFIKCALTSDHYTMNILGHMNYKRHFGFNGQVNVHINDQLEFFDFLGLFTKEKTIKKWQTMLRAMNEPEITGIQSNNIISFRVIGNNNEIMWGKLPDHSFTKLLVQQ